MDKAQRLRMALLLCALAATVAAIILPGPDADVAASPPSSVTPASVRKQDAVVLKARQPDWVFSDENPFLPRGWAPPPPPPPDARVVTSLVQTDPLPSSAPPLPFKFLGQMIDGADRLVYLGLGDQVLIARAGEVLEGSYKVLTVTPAQIEFELIASGIHQTLPLPAQEHE